MTSHTKTHTIPQIKKQWHVKRMWHSLHYNCSTRSRLQKENPSCCTAKQWLTLDQDKAILGLEQTVGKKVLQATTNYRALRSDIKIWALPSTMRSLISFRTCLLSCFESIQNNEIKSTHIQYGQFQWVSSFLFTAYNCHLFRNTKQMFTLHNLA